jgi:hypothetical protein
MYAHGHARVSTLYQTARPRLAWARCGQRSPEKPRARTCRRTTWRVFPCEHLAIAGMIIVACYPARITTRPVPRVPLCLLGGGFIRLSPAAARSSVTSQNEGKAGTKALPAVAASLSPFCDQAFLRPHSCDFSLFSPAL